MTDTTNLTRRVLRFDVPIDDTDHDIAAGRIVHVAAERPDRWRPAGGRVGEAVEVWVDTQVDEQLLPDGYQTVRVYRTAQPVPDDVAHAGTCLAGRLVWHLFTKPATS